MQSKAFVRLEPTLSKGQKTLVFVLRVKNVGLKLTGSILLAQRQLQVGIAVYIICTISKCQ